MNGNASLREVLVVIVNYRSAGLTIDCLRSLGPEVQALAETNATRVVVVENASGDGSAEQIDQAIQSEGWGAWAALIRSPSNGGFAAGNNLAIARALASDRPPAFVWLLNPDTVIRPGACRELIAFLDRHPDVGLVGSRIESLDGSVQASAFRFPSILSEMESGLRLAVVSKLLKRRLISAPISESEVRAEWVSGASLMVRREVFDAVGLLDEGYFLYFEEVDFCLKAARAGWPCWYEPRSKVLHLVGQSTGVTSSSEPTRRRPRYWFEARRRYFLNNHGRLKTLVADLGFTLSYATFRARQWIQRKPDQEPRWMLRDFLRYNFLPTVKR